MNEDHYIPLIQKSLNNTLNQEEADQLKKWLSVEDNQNFYEDIKTAWEVDDINTSSLTIDNDKEWNILNKKIANKKSFNIRWLVGLAAGVTILLASMFLLTQEKVYTVEANEDNQMVQMTDGSKISLKKGSTLTYTDSFHKNRRVELKGSAYLDVVKMSGNPFVIDGASIEVTVLGTQFIMSDAPDDYSAEVQLIEGKVNINNKAAQTQTNLTANQRYNLQASGEKVINGLSLNNQSWYPIEFIYNSSKLSEVIKDLENYHGVSIEIESYINECVFSGNMNRLTLDEALQNIAVLYNAELLIRDGKYSLTQGSCQ